MKARTLAAAAAALLLLATATPAHADESVHPDIAAMLLEVPGGEPLGYYAAYWPVLDMTMEVPNPMLRTVGGCATGYICAFTAGGATGGNKLSWGTCSTATIPTNFLTASVANARAAGSVAQARVATTIIASVSAGSWKNVSGIDNIRCLE